MQKELQPQPRGRPVPGVARRPGFLYKILCLKKELKMVICIFREKALTSLKMEIR